MMGLMNENFGEMEMEVVWEIFDVLKDLIIFKW